jgi:2-keto-4-pentenoate hydratase/2-oxohepta-3-ene-1,7-dioic acid hydratase in catechol pathway
MHRMRFRDPAGSVRTGEFQDNTVSFGGQTYDIEDVDVLPPTEPTKIICIGLNYADHAAESGSEIPDRPLMFLKGPNTLSGHEDTISLLPGKDRIEYEAELGIVIDQQCRNVAREEAMDVVAGFTCVNDVSNRDDQRREQNWVRGKAFDNAAPIGPVIATPDEVPEDAAVQSRINGDLRQDGTRADFIFSVPELIEEITTYMTLEPGDVIATGTPEGVGPVTDGDTVEIEVEGVGTLTNYITAE